MMPPATFAPPLAVNPVPTPRPPAVFPAPISTPQSAAVVPALPPVVRGQAPEEPALRPVAAASPVPAIPPAPPVLVMPTPNQLGVAPPIANDGGNGWGRLERLGATAFRVERSAAGGFRATCVVAGTQANRDRRFEGEASSQAEAVRLVLDQAEAWTANR